MTEIERPFDPELPRRVAAVLEQIRAANEGFDADFVWVLQDGEDRVSLAELQQLLERFAFASQSAEQLAGKCVIYRGQRDGYHAQVDELEAKLQRDHLELRDKRTDLLNIRGILHPADRAPFCAVPMELLLDHAVAPAIEWLVARVAELEAERDDLAAQLGEDHQGCAITPNRYVLSVDTWNGTIQLRCTACEPKLPETHVALVDSEIYSHGRTTTLSRMVASAARHEEQHTDDAPTAPTENGSTVE